MTIRNALFATVLAAGALFTAACGGDEAKIEKLVKITEDMAAAVTSAGEDCSKMGSNLESFASKNEGDLKDIKEWMESVKKDKSKQEEMKKLADKYKDRLSKAMPAMMGMMKCADDPKVKAAGDKLKFM